MSVGAEPGVSQREYDRFVKTTDEDIAALWSAHNALKKQREDDLKAAKQIRIAAVAAGASVVAAWVGLFELWQSLAR